MKQVKLLEETISIERYFSSEQVLFPIVPSQSLSTDTLCAQP